jgi:uncharacterized membrane protein
MATTRSHSINLLLVNVLYLNNHSSYIVGATAAAVAALTAATSGVNYGAAAAAAAGGGKAERRQTNYNGQNASAPGNAANVSQAARSHPYNRN